MSNVASINDSYKQTYYWWDDYVVVNFTSDGSVNKRGFKIEYNVVIGTGHACGSDKPLVIENSTQGYIQSPNYPDNYPSGLDCLWKLKVGDGLRMTIRIVDVLVENG